MSDILMGFGGLSRPISSRDSEGYRVRHPHGIGVVAASIILKGHVDKVIFRVDAKKEENWEGGHEYIGDVASGIQAKSSLVSNGKSLCGRT